MVKSDNHGKQNHYASPSLISQLWRNKEPHEAHVFTRAAPLHFLGAMGVLRTEQRVLDN